MWKRLLTSLAVSLSCHGAPPPAAPAAAPAHAATPDAADRLSDHVQPRSYALDFEVAPDAPGFSGRARIELDIAQAVDSIQLHAKDLHLERITLSLDGGAPGPAVEPSQVDDGGLLALDLSGPVGPGRATLELDFSGTFNPHLRGLYRVETGQRAYVFTQLEPTHARQVFPCFDEPRFKTPFDITLRVPDDVTGISNTKLVNERSLGDGQKELSFARTEKLPTYLVALAVGPLDVVYAPPIAPNEARPEPLALRGVAARGRGPELSFALQETPRLLASLERYFGLGYPYDKLDLIAVPDFASGAMENAGAITFRDTLLLLNYRAPEWQRRLSVSVNAHELAHQWFGNLVTMPWWDDIWLNEGFATWLAGRVVDEVHPEYRADLLRVALLERAFEMDAKASARQVRQPIVTEHDIRNAFDAITYTKGGALLAMFERYLGADTFREGLRSYLLRHRFGSATSGDLMTALEQSSGQPVARAFGSFLDQPGVPTISAELRCSEGPPRVRLAQRRYVPLGSRLTPGDEAWNVPVCVRHGGGEGEPGERCLLLEAREAELPLDAAQCPTWVLPNARAAGYYRWSLRDDALTALLDAGYSALDASERLSLLSNIEASARAGQLSFEQLMRVTLLAGADEERELVQAALGVLSRVRDALLGEAELPAYRHLVQQLIGARQRRLGLFPVRRESGDTKLLRPALVAALAFEARDASLRRDLDRLGRAQLGLFEDRRALRLSSELLEMALSVAVQESGEKVIERLVAALAVSHDGIERARLLGALGSNLDPELTPEVLELSLSDHLRTNERLTPVFGQLRQKETRRAAAAWVEEHFDALISRLGKELGAQLTAVAGAFCSPEDAARAEKFLAPRAEALTGGPRRLRLQLESTELCAAFAGAHRDAAKRYFTAASGS